MTHEDVNQLSDSRLELRKRILSVAREAFMRHGIKSVTMDEIANLLSISKRTLYEVFRDKETLLIECIRCNQEEFRQFIAEVDRKSDNVLEVILKFYKRTLEIYHDTNKRYYEDLCKYPKLKALMHDTQIRESERRIQFFQKGKEQGIFRDDVNLEIVNELVKAQVDLLINTEICELFSFEEVYESIIFTYIRGVCTEKGQRILENFVNEHKKQEEQKSGK